MLIIIINNNNKKGYTIKQYNDKFTYIKFWTFINNMNKGNMFYLHCITNKYTLDFLFL